MAKKYCYLEPEFPQSGFLISVFFRDAENGMKFLYPMIPLFASIDQAVKYVERDEKRYIKRRIFPYGAAVYKLVCQDRLPLKKEYWTKTTGEIGSYERMMAFLELSKHPLLYRVVVVPRYYDKKIKDFNYAVAHPFYVSSDNRPLEMYMLKSQMPVDEKAKSAAIYGIEEVFGWGWESKKLKKVDGSNVLGVDREEIN